MRVAVTQFATSLNVQENLATCIRMIDEAAVCGPDLILLPEFCNTHFCNVQPCYIDHNHAWNDAISANGTFLSSIAEQAKKHNCYLVLNVTLRRDVERDHQDGTIKSNICVTSCLFSPQGKLIQQVDKQTLIGHEYEFFSYSANIAEAFETPVGKLGLLIGNDDMTFDIPRELALTGAQLLCHSMSSFAVDQSALYGPTRASENSLFFASANKVGLLMPKEESALYAEKSNVPQEALVGAGQSQIVSPEGKVLAKIADKQEGIAFADIDIIESGIYTNNFRPDGSDIIKQRRPEIYNTQHLKTDSIEDNNKVPVTANVAIFATYKSNEQAIEDVYHYIEQNLTDIIQLPELFFIADKTIINNAQQRAEVEAFSKMFINTVSTVLRPYQYVCTSLVIDDMHQAVIISEHGLIAKQQQLHFCQRYQWTSLGDEVNIIELSLEQGKINVAMLTADDANIAEIVKIAAVNNIHVLLVPFDIQEPCEVEYSLLARAAENRICIVAASREKSFTNEQAIDSTNPFGKNKIKKHKSTGLIINLTTDSSLLPQWKPRKFNGYINQPLVKYQHGKITKAVIHPIAACDKTPMS